jgi:hypothetical protein
MTIPKKIFATAIQLLCAAGPLFIAIHHPSVVATIGTAASWFLAGAVTASIWNPEKPESC